MTASLRFWAEVMAPLTTKSPALSVLIGWASGNIRYDSKRNFKRLIGLSKSTVDGGGDKFFIVAIDDYNRRQRTPSMCGVRAH
jgi:hypothetical protein